MYVELRQLTEQAQLWTDSNWSFAFAFHELCIAYYPASVSKALGTESASVQAQPIRDRVAAEHADLELIADTSESGVEPGAVTPLSISVSHRLQLPR